MKLTEQEENQILEEIISLEEENIKLRQIIEKYRKIISFADDRLCYIEVDREKRNISSEKEFCFSLNLVSIDGEGQLHEKVMEKIRCKMKSRQNVLSNI